MSHCRIAFPSLGNICVFVVPLGLKKKKICVKEKIFENLVPFSIILLNLPRVRTYF